MKTKVPAVTLDKWSLTYRDKDSPSLSEISLNINVGEKVLIVGPSGGGKSTLLRSLAGLVDPVIVRERGKRRLYTKSVSLVGQEPDEQILFPTIREEVAFVAETVVDTFEEIDELVNDSLASVGVTNPLETPTGALSGGEKHRLALATAVAAKADLILLDEPTASLDAPSVELVQSTVSRVVDETKATLVIVEHRITTWRRHVDRLIVIAEGKIVLDGPIETVLSKHRQMLLVLGVWVPGHARAQKPTELPTKSSIVLQSKTLNVARSTDARNIKVPAITLRAGMAIAIVGPNGAGKSTALRALGGLIAPKRGSITYAGSAVPPHRLAPKRLVDFVASVLQNPAYGFGDGIVSDEAPAHERAAVGLRGFDKRHPQSLSGGERRRLALATAMAQRPLILFLDEPTFGQDSRSWQDMVERLRDYLLDGGSIVMATHDRMLIKSIAHSVIELG